MTTSNPQQTIGVDLGDRRSHVCVLADDGQVLEEVTVETTAAGLRGWFSRQARSLVVLEACTQSRWTAQVIGELGHQVLVANPRKVALIYGAERKNDRVDAERLARLGRVDPSLLSPVVHRSEAAQQALLTIKTRATLVATRTRLVNAVRSLCKGFGVRLPSCSAASFHRQAPEHIPEDILVHVAPLLTTLEFLANQVAETDRTVVELSQGVYPETEVLRQVPGVGPITALAYVLTIDDPRRFADSRDVGPYLGLTPRQDQSGTLDRQLPITKCGDRMMRTLLVQAAHYMVGPFGKDTDLRRWALRRIEGGMTRRKAIVAVARKLAVLLHRLWVNGEVYEPLKAQAA
jgi:transposase